MKIPFLRLLKSLLVLTSIAALLTGPFHADAAMGARGKAAELRSRRSGNADASVSAGGSGGEKGGKRGRNLRMFSFAASLIYRLQFPGAEKKEDTSERMPLSDADIRYICTMKKLLSPEASGDTADWLSSRIASLMKRDEKRIIAVLRDGTSCAGKPAVSRPNR